MPDVNTFLMPAGASPFAGPSNHIVAGVIAGRTAADVIVIVSIAVDELYRIIACLFYRWHGQDDRLSAQVQPQDGIECVAVGRDYYCILVSHQARFVENL